MIPASRGMHQSHPKIFAIAPIIFHDLQCRMLRQHRKVPTKLVEKCKCIMMSSVPTGGYVDGGKSSMLSHRVPQRSVVRHLLFPLYTADLGELASKLDLTSTDDTHARSGFSPGSESSRLQQ